MIGVSCDTCAHNGTRNAECRRCVEYAQWVPPAPDIAGAKKFDGDKPMLDLLTHGCPHALNGVGTVLTYGFKKYGGKHGWKSLPDAMTRYEAALMRHILARAAGETHDPESGLPHSHHIACNALFIAELEKLNATEAS